MPLSEPRRRQAFERISGSSGGLAMVAMDQRESLRTMFEEATRERATDSTLADFKLAVSETLAPHATAILLDRLYGMDAMRAVSPSCGLVLAADKLEQPPGQPVLSTSLDLEVDGELARSVGAAALKLLVIWRPDERPEDRIVLTRSFLDLCEREELLGIVEGVVRPPGTGDDPTWDREESILEAARELGALRPDLYKAEIPLHGRGEPREIQTRCQAISNAIPCPWVVLSSGVTSDDFPRAVEAACHGGASGFLAGRGIWMDLVGSGDYRQRLEDVAVPRLERLRDIVQHHARPWPDAISTRA